MDKQKHQQSLDETSSTQTTTSNQNHQSKYSLINVKLSKHILAEAIFYLSNQVQAKNLNNPLNSGDVNNRNRIILSLDNEASEHIEQIILDVLNLILTANLINYDQSTPEAACALVMSAQENSSQTTTALQSLTPISSISEAEQRVRQVLPRQYADMACSKAENLLSSYKIKASSTSKYHKFLKTTKDKLLTSTNENTQFYNSSHGGSTLSTADATIAQFLKFPVEQIHAKLNEIYQCKSDFNVTFYLVAVLECICKDILSLSTNFVRNLDKFTITKSEVCMAIHADALINNIYKSTNSTNSENNHNYTNSLFFNSNSGSSTYLCDDYYDFDLGPLRTQTSFSYRTNDNLDASSITTISSGYIGTIRNSNEECNSDSSTICGESTVSSSGGCYTITNPYGSNNYVNHKYTLKVRELILEQNQHLNDLNVLRRIFMYLFKKLLNEHSYGIHDQDEQHKLIEDIFGNINDVYECALLLADSLDEVMLSAQPVPDQPQQTILIGEHLWMLAEGNEFEVYLKFAEIVTNYEQVKNSLIKILNNKPISISLNKIKYGLTEISKYLLPKLLLGSVHYFLYLYETIEYLVSVSGEDNDFAKDASFLNQTLDTLRSTKFQLNKKCFKNSRQRPIETSFRMFQSNQFNQIGMSSNSNLISTSQMTNSVNSLGQTSNISNLSINSKIQTLVSNVGALTELKWKEIENNVESFKLPTCIIISPQIISSNSNSSSGTYSFSANNSNISNFTSNIINGSNIRYAYLYEGSLIVHKSNQSVPNPSKSFLSNHKYKQSKRYVFLFDGLLVLVKQQHQFGTNSNYMYKFKEAISLEKCILKDREDDLSFELIFNGNINSINQANDVSQNSDGLLASSDATALSSAAASSPATNSSSPGQDNNQEIFLFTAENSNEKYKWMSMLCYSLYKFTIDSLLQTMTDEHNKNNPIPIPDYMFSQPDKPETILFETVPQNQQTRKQELNPYVSSDGLAIKAATLVKLIERLTHHRYLDPKFSHTFLMFFREFCSPRKLLDLLSKRYDVPDLESDLIHLNYKFDRSLCITEREIIKRYKREYQQPIRLKVINLIKHWIDGYFTDDFANDNELLESLKEFINKVEASNKRYQEVLAKSLQKKLNSLKQEPELTEQTDENKMDQISIESMPVTNPENTDLNNLKNVFKISSSLSTSSSMSQVSSSSRTSSTSEDILQRIDPNDMNFPPFETHLERSYPYDILSLHPLEFARQATLMESELFRAIKANELISLGWNKPSLKHKLSPNVTKLINLSNKFTYWYAKCIVDTRNFEERCAVVARILDIAQYFYQMNNFSGLKEIFAAFETSSVTRLQLTRAKSCLEQHKMYTKFKYLFESHDKGYWDRLRKCSPPCIPFIGIHLTIIYRTHEFNKLNIENHKMQIIKQQQKHIKEMSNSSCNSDEDVLIDNKLQRQQSDSSNVSDTDDEQTSLINFSKYRLLVEFVNDLLQYQNVSYRFRVNEQIRSFLLEDIENYFREAQLAATNVNPNESSESIETAPQTPAQMVESWLFSKSKQIEPNDIEPNKFPRIRNYPLKSPPPAATSQDISNKNKQGPFLSKQNANSVSSSKINQKLIQQQVNAVSGSSFVAPIPLSQSSSIGKLNNKKLTDIKPITSTSASVVTLVRSSSSHHEDKSTHKRSNSSTLVKKYPPVSSITPPPSQLPPPPHLPPPPPPPLAPPPIPPPPPNRHDSMNLDTISTTSLSQSSGSTIRPLASSSLTTLSSAVMFPQSTNTTTLPFVSSSSSSSSPSPTLYANQQSNNNSAILTNQNEHGLASTKPHSSSVSSENAILSTLGYNLGHGQEKLSLSSADSSSSAPNSPPPNYDEVFDLSSVNTNLPQSQSVLFASTITPSISAISGLSSNNNLNVYNNLINNNFDNLTYYQRHSGSSSSSNSSLSKNTSNSPLLQPSQASYQVISESTNISGATSYFSKMTKNQKPIFSFPEIEHKEKQTIQNTSTSNARSSITRPEPPQRPPPPPPCEPPPVPPLPPPQVANSSFHSINLPPPSEIPKPPPVESLLSDIPPPLPARNKKKPG